ncbi:hypothetical protein E1211_02750 [Micromonospora sp. 15K316]|uniref:hypothetical protein n=1 Tax=Micromonospora sp. 15K316 TaxID=2530376 RepID=UPI001042B599|nr:hypothetical protein [Micromonospora sp. 15K316]TDC39926.1 hypothetical protein E1211_02750 [Micromonospora sp. 15K316]
MTVGRFREVDHDLLADYLGGALDGTPEQVVVARLVAEDAAWAEAYAQLAPAVAAVEGELARWGEPVAEMPPEVVEQITAALAALPPPAGGGETGSAGVEVAATDGGTGFDARATPGTPTEKQPGPDEGPAGSPLVPAQGGPRRPAAGVPRSDRGATTGPGRRRRRLVRMAGPVALAAVAVAAVGIGVDRLAGGGDDAQTSGTALDAPANAPEAASAPVRTTGPATHSGTDYTPQSLGSFFASNIPKTLEGSPLPTHRSAAGTTGDRLSAPDGSDRLARLADPAALATCLREIATEHRAGPLVADLVDYAAFQGEQALVVRFTDAGGARWAWVSGPECGVPGSGADTRYRTRVG